MTGQHMQKLKSIAFHLLTPYLLTPIQIKFNSSSDHGVDCLLYSSTCQAFLLTYEMWWRCLQEATYRSSGQLHCCLWNYPGWGLNWTQEPCPLFQTWVMKANLLVPSNSQCSMVDSDQRNLSMRYTWLSFFHAALVCHWCYLSPLWKTTFQLAETFAFKH
jgi:hypothetical protein